MDTPINTKEEDAELIALEAEWNRLIAENDAATAATERTFAEIKTKTEVFEKNFKANETKTEGPIARFIGNIFLVIHFLILGWAVGNFVDEFKPKK